MRRLEAALALSTAAALWAAGCGRRAPASDQQPARVTNVRVEVLRPHPAEDRVVLPGRVEAWSDVLLSAEVEGRVRSVSADEGDTVSAGDVVLEIDPAVLRAQRDQASAALAALRAEEAKMKAGARPEELASAEADVRAAEAAVKQAAAALAEARAAEENARRDLARVEKLFRDGAESRERLDAVRTSATIARRRRESAEEGLRNARERLSAARDRLRLVREGARREDREALAARVKEAEALLRLAEIKLRKATVRAPAPGIIRRRYVDAGEYVRAGTPLADLVDLGRVKVTVAVPERDVVWVRKGQEMTVAVDALSRRYGGRVIFVSPSADPKTLTFETKVALENRDGAIRPGMIARVVLVRRRLAQALTAPIFAVIKREKGYAAFVEAGGKARRRAVELGFFVGDRVVVRSGLKPGDRLIVAGQRDLADGDRVRVVETVSTPAGAPAGAPADAGTGAGETGSEDL